MNRSSKFQPSSKNSHRTSSSQSQSLLKGLGRDIHGGTKKIETSWDKTNDEFERCPFCGQVLVTAACIDCPYVRHSIDPLPELAWCDDALALGVQLGCDDDPSVAEAGRMLAAYAEKRMKRIEREAEL